MPNNPVATNRTTLPGIATARLGIPNLSEFMDRPPRTVRMAKLIVIPIAPPTIMMRLPTRSIRSQANVMRKKYEM